MMKSFQAMEYEHGLVWKLRTISTRVAPLLQSLAHQSFWSLTKVLSTLLEAGWEDPFCTTGYETLGKSTMSEAPINARMRIVVPVTLLLFSPNSRGDGGPKVRGSFACYHYHLIKNLDCISPWWQAERFLSCDLLLVYRILWGIACTSMTWNTQLSWWFYCWVLGTVLLSCSMIEWAQILFCFLALKDFQWIPFYETACNRAGERRHSFSKLNIWLFHFFLFVTRQVIKWVSIHFAQC